MEDPNTILKSRLALLLLFLNELPDPNQKLAAQDLDGIPNTFTLFPKLPMELQLAIWRQAFPDSRRIELKTGIRCHIPRHNLYRSRNDYCFCAPKPTYHPITLRINRASRYETLKYYKPILRRVGVGHHFMRNNARYQTVYVNMDRDVFVLDYAVHTCGPFIPKSWWLRDLSIMNPGVFAAIRVLEIREWYVSRFWSWHDMFMRGYNTLDEFTGLDEVRLLLLSKFDKKNGSRCHVRRRQLGFTEDWPDRPFDSADVWMSESFISGIFNKARTKNPNIRIPEVKVCNWKNKPCYKSFFDVIDEDLLGNYPLLQRFVNGDFSAFI